jgi:hypothetical protein
VGWGGVGWGGVGWGGGVGDAHVLDDVGWGRVGGRWGLVAVQGALLSSSPRPRAATRSRRSNHPPRPGAAISPDTPPPHLPLVGVGEVPPVLLGDLLNRRPRSHLRDTGEGGRGGEGGAGRGGHLHGRLEGLGPGARARTPARSAPAETPSRLASPTPPPSHLILQHCHGERLQLHARPHVLVHAVRQDLAHSQHAHAVLPQHLGGAEFAAGRAASREAREAGSRRLTAGCDGGAPGRRGPLFAAPRGSSPWPSPHLAEVGVVGLGHLDVDGPLEQRAARVEAAHHEGRALGLAHDDDLGGGCGGVGLVGLARRRRRRRRLQG